MSIVASDDKICKKVEQRTASAGEWRQENKQMTLGWWKVKKKMTLTQ